MKTLEKTKLTEREAQQKLLKAVFGDVLEHKIKTVMDSMANQLAKQAVAEFWAKYEIDITFTEKVGSVELTQPIINLKIIKK